MNLKQELTEFKDWWNQNCTNCLIWSKDVEKYMSERQNVNVDDMGELK